MQGALLSPQRGATGNVSSPSLVLSSFSPFLLFLKKKKYPKSTFWLSKHIFGLSHSQHLISKHCFLCLQQKASNYSTGPT